jgi:multisubunit Na+/H+ antiporter MnhE subunit
LPAHIHSWFCSLRFVIPFASVGSISLCIRGMQLTGSAVSAERVFVSFRFFLMAPFWFLWALWSEQIHLHVFTSCSRLLLQTLFNTCSTRCKSKLKQLGKDASMQLSPPVLTIDESRLTPYDLISLTQRSEQKHSAARFLHSWTIY